MKRIIYFLSLLLLFSCGNSKNAPEFMAAVKGRYLFNSNEVIDIYFEQDILKVKWREQNMTPIKANDSSFYLKEMNEKLIFVSSPEMHIELAPKREHNGSTFSFSKLKKGEKTASEYFEDKEYDKAKTAFIEIQRRDSLDPTIRQRVINSNGYKFLRDDKIEEAKEMFAINIALYPKKSNVYDSMGDAFKKDKDTLQAITYYKKALQINPENRAAKRSLKKLTKEEK